MTEKNTQIDQEACSVACAAAVNELLGKFDGRLVAACMAAETAMIASSFRKAQVWDTEFIVGFFSEAMVAALTVESKAKIIFTDGKDSGSRQ